MTLALSHVGITVPDLDAALQWYEDVLGFVVRFPPSESTTETPDAPRMRQLMGPRFGRVRYAMMETGSGVFLEVFQSTDPPTAPAGDRAEFWRTGPWHIAVTSPDVDGLAATIESTGGRALSDTWPLVEGLPFTIRMCADPFGVTIEIYSHPIEEILDAIGS